MAAQYDNRVREYEEETAQHDPGASAANRCCAGIERAVHDNPLASTLAVFGVGLGVGALVGHFLAASGSDSKWSHPSSYSEQMRSALADVMPDSIARRLRE